MDEDDPELSCFCLVSLEDNYCQVISITEAVSLSTFYVRASMQRVQLLIEASAGMPSRLVMIFLVQPGLNFDLLKRYHHLYFLMKS